MAELDCKVLALVGHIWRVIDSINMRECPAHLCFEAIQKVENPRCETLSPAGLHCIALHSKTSAVTLLETPSIKEIVEDANYKSAKSM